VAGAGAAISGRADGEMLSAEREAMAKQQDYNQHYGEFLKDAVFPAVEELVQVLSKGADRPSRQHLGKSAFTAGSSAWRWGELVVMQSHEDAVTFEHHIITEGGEAREETTRRRIIRISTICAISYREPWRAGSCSFFLTRLALDLVEQEPEPEIPPGETPPGE